MAKHPLKPLIGITGPRKYGNRAWTAAKLCVWLAGGRPIRLTPNHPDPPAPLDGIVIGGGDDIDPLLFNRERLNNRRYDLERDAFESIMIEEALARHIPLLGICRGAQLLNVRLGGSLHLDLREHRKITSNRGTPLPLKTLLIEPGSKLHHLFGVTRAKINSLHQQSIDQLGKGLHIAGRDLDQIVQAVENPSHPFLMGVQWHPEYLPYDRRQRRVFQRLVQTAADKAP